MAVIDLTGESGPDVTECRTPGLQQAMQRLDAKLLETADTMEKLKGQVEMLTQQRDLYFALYNENTRGRKQDAEVIRQLSAQVAGMQCAEARVVAAVASMQQSSSPCCTRD